MSTSKDVFIFMDEVEIVESAGILLNVPIFFILSKGKLISAKKILVLKDIRKEIPYYSLENKECPCCSFPWGLIARTEKYMFWMCGGAKCLLQNFLGGIKKPLPNITIQQRHRMTKKNNHIFLDQEKTNNCPDQRELLISVNTLTLPNLKEALSGLEEKELSNVQ